ncbi:daptide-type RiPP biosynthesis dehydogenase [Streptomyces sp. NPDC088864]|uniref:daptide-type RiPP biosynthesis dehydogenase n=1 Tax=Streptomyces sp. NPDC088864 TaxID=3365910 RepID=UPI00381AE5E5
MTSAVLPPPDRVTLAGIAALAARIGQDPVLDAPGRTVLLVDGGVLDTPVHRRLTEVLGARPYESLTLTGAGDVDGVLALGARLEGAARVFALGGGALLDRAKLATLAVAGRAVAGRLTVPQRSGLVVLTRVPPRPMPLIAVPTTIGTGSEASAVACLGYPDAKRLVMAAELRPEFAVRDPLAVGTLPRHLFVEGVLEAFFRLVSPYIGDHADQPEPDARVRAGAAELLRLGYEVVATTRTGAPTTTTQRERAARLSAEIHTRHFHDERDPYAVKGWLVANELSTVLGLRKMTAVAALLPPLWRAIDRGETRLGSRRRLRGLWSAVRAGAGQPLPADPADGVAALIDAWCVGRRVTAAPGTTVALAHRIVRVWGAGLPMLGGLGHAEVLRLLRATVTEPGTAPVRPGPVQPRADTAARPAGGRLAPAT